MHSDSPGELRVTGNDDVDGLLGGVLSHGDGRARRRGAAAVGIGLQRTGAEDLRIAGNGQLAGANLDAGAAGDGAAGDGGRAVVSGKVKRRSIFGERFDSAAGHGEVHAAPALRAVSAEAEDLGLNLTAGNLDLRAVLGAVADGTDAVRSFDQTALEGNVCARIVVGGVDAVVGNLERAALHDHGALRPGHDAKRERTADLVDLERTRALRIIERQPPAVDDVERTIIDLNRAAVQVERDGLAVDASRLLHRRISQNLDGLAVSRSVKSLGKGRVLNVADDRNHRRHILRSVGVRLVRKQRGCRHALGRGFNRRSRIQRSIFSRRCGRRIELLLDILGGGALHLFGNGDGGNVERRDERRGQRQRERLASFRLFFHISPSFIWDSTRFPQTGGAPEGESPSNVIKLTISSLSVNKPLLFFTQSCR